jgi:hypothetical protein
MDHTLSSSFLLRLVKMKEARDIVDKICEEFGPLSRIQACKIEERISQGGVGYVLEKAEVVRQMVRSKPIRNLAGAFMKALDDWKSPRSSEPPIREKPRPAVQDLLFEEPSDEQLTKYRGAIAAMKATLRDA